MFPNKIEAHASHSFRQTCFPTSSAQCEAKVVVNRILHIFGASFYNSSLYFAELIGQRFSDFTDKFTLPLKMIR